MRGFVASPDGSRMVSAESAGGNLQQDPEAFGRALAAQLAARGAREILASLSHD
jgi:porphobilinogen deaminase